MPALPGKRSLRARARRVAAELGKLYPDAGCVLDDTSPLRVLVATILSAQCTDKKVNEVTPALFARYPTADAFAAADRAELEGAIHSIGLYRSKARNIIAAAERIRDVYDGRVPDTIDELVTLPGVGRKTANCVVLNGYGKPGLMCDTHFCRLVQRIGLTDESDPVKIESALAELLPPEEWGGFSHRIIIHGRRICRARRPRCDLCGLRKWCDTGGRMANPP